MPVKRTVAELFETNPVRWGLRGDPYLWDEMKLKAVEHDYPATEEECLHLIEKLFQQLTGAPITQTETVFVERYDQGGMSSGHISPQFWHEQALPLLLKRYRESR